MALSTCTDPGLLAEVLRHALDGVAVVAAGDGPPRVVYGNATLAALLRRPEEWLEGRSLDEIEIEAPADPTQTTSTAVGVRVRLKRVDGTTVECERWAVMLPESRIAMYYRPGPRSAPGALAAALERSSGLSTPEHLLEVLRRDWSIAQRDGRMLTVMRFNIDAWREYVEVFGRGPGENVLRQVGRTVATATKRASDIVAKQGDDEFVVLGVSMDPTNAARFADQIIGRVRSLAIHHPRSTIGRYMTVSAGVVTAVAPRDKPCEVILEAAAQALRVAKAKGGNCVVSGDL
jgi:diguanylate cyclase (GGDEF)-like protein